MNPNYEGTYLFTNDFQALLEDTPKPGKNKVREGVGWGGGVVRWVVVLMVVCVNDIFKWYCTSAMFC